MAIGGLLQGKNYVVGLGARPSRAGSIGRDSPRHGESTVFPPQEAGGASPCPIHGEIGASWFQAEWTGVQTMGTLGILIELFLLQTSTHPSLDDHKFTMLKNFALRQMTPWLALQKNTFDKPEMSIQAKLLR